MLQILFCNSEAGLRMMGIFGILVSIIKTIIPIILIVVGTISLVKCIINQDGENTKRELNSLVKKAVLGVAIFFLPSIIIFLINLVADNTSGQKCMSCLLDNPTECMMEANNIKSGKATILCSTYNGDPEKCTRPCKYVNGFCNRMD